jgi:serine/threonine protein kinase
VSLAIADPPQQKPENILMGTKGDSLDVKIADFGVAKELEKGCKTLVGSYSYIAPEVLERKNTVHGKGRYDSGADVWSLGVVLYVMLSGRFPFAQVRGSWRVMHSLVGVYVLYRLCCWGCVSRVFIRETECCATNGCFGNGTA